MHNMEIMANRPEIHDIIEELLKTNKLLDLMKKKFSLCIVWNINFT